MPPSSDEQSNMENGESLGRIVDAYVHLDQEYPGVTLPGKQYALTVGVLVRNPTEEDDSKYIAKLSEKIELWIVINFNTTEGMVWHDGKEGSTGLFVVENKPGVLQSINFMVSFIHNEHERSNYHNVVINFYQDKEHIGTRSVTTHTVGLG